MFEVPSKFYDSLLEDLSIHIFLNLHFATYQQPFCDVLYGGQGVQMLDGLIQTGPVLVKLSVLIPEDLIREVSVVFVVGGADSFGDGTEYAAKVRSKVVVLRLI